MPTTGENGCSPPQVFPVEKEHEEWVNPSSV